MMNSPSWEKNLRDFPRQIKNLELSNKLKHDIPFIPASDLGSQYYCEKKVDLSREIGERETQAKNIGKEGHEKLMEYTEEVSLEEVIEKIKLGNTYHLRESPVLGIFEDVPFGGFPDDIIFYRQKPILVGDLRITGRDSLWPGRDKKVQVKVYCLALDQMGFDCSKLKGMIGVEHARAREELEIIGSVENL